MDFFLFFWTLDPKSGTFTNSINLVIFKSTYSEFPKRRHGSKKLIRLKKSTNYLARDT